MASLRQNKKTKTYQVSFRYGDRQFTKSLQTKTKSTAVAHVARVEETIRLLRSGRINLPADADAGDFIISDGRTTAKKRKLPKRVTLKVMFDFYESGLPGGAKEAETLKGEKRHCEHLLRLLGGSRLVTDLGTHAVQEYVLKRAKEKWNKRSISPQTIKKELTTLRLIWNWCKDRGLVSGGTPTRGGVLPKMAEKPRFMTMTEIRSTIERGNVSQIEERLFWESLFLNKDETSELLAHVKKNAKYRFIYPMFVFIAHTGVRRSEMTRSRIDDLNFENGVILIREKKKSRVKSVTYRHIEMSPLFESVMREWTSTHPGGQHTICFSEEIDGRRGEPLSNDVSNHHFEHALSKSKWDVVRGFHTFRHSFASNLAASGADQRIIDDFMGHQTEEMRRRYRHLFPCRVVSF